MKHSIISETRGPTLFELGRGKIKLAFQRFKELFKPSGFALLIKIVISIHIVNEEQPWVLK